MLITIRSHCIDHANQILLQWPYEWGPRYLPASPVPEAAEWPQPHRLVLAGTQEGVLVVKGNQRPYAASVSLKRLKFDLLEIKDGVPLT